MGWSGAGINVQVLVEYATPTRDCVTITANVIEQNTDSLLNLIRICVSCVDAQKEFQFAFAEC
jgi:hypothetical protein